MPEYSIDISRSLFNDELVLLFAVDGNKGSVFKIPKTNDAIGRFYEMLIDEWSTYMEGTIGIKKDV